jgi:uncharacterized protein
MTGNRPTIDQLISRLKLQPLDLEGGWFFQTYQDPGLSTPHGFPSPRPWSTAIYYLMTPKAAGFSALHRLRGVEILFFLLGDPVESLVIHPNGKSEQPILGTDILNGQVLQLIIPSGCWQGHRVKPGGEYALIGTTMAPGYDQQDFELGDRDELCQLYPDLKDEINLLTRL